MVITVAVVITILTKMILLGIKVDMSANAILQHLLEAHLEFLFSVGLAGSVAN